MKAATIIVRGIERNAEAVFVGNDAILMDKLHRLSPRFAAGASAKRMGGLLPS
jgi:hypothetical protein